MLLDHASQSTMSNPKTTQLILITIILTLQTSLSFHNTPAPAPAPLPILPIPTSNHLKRYESDLTIFLHFGTNTFTDSEWGDGSASPSLFSPSRLETSHWVNVASSTGFSRLILTAKHHDGFCLWPSQYTNYSVKSSPWRGGEGDVVAELSAEARMAGIELGLYLSPWDRHEDCYGQTLEYNQFYLAQLTELLTRYS